jgi:hypothetical protein
VAAAGFALAGFAASSLNKAKSKQKKVRRYQIENWNREWEEFRIEFEVGTDSTCIDTLTCTSTYHVTRVKA